MNTTSPPTDRRADLDALRAIAMLLGIVLHAALSFFPSAWMIADSRQAPALGVFVSAVHGFRMPVFFVMSGFFSAMLLQRRGRGSLVKHRFRRVFLPLLLGLFTVIPATNWISGIATSSAVSNLNETPSPVDEESTLWAAAEAGRVDAIERHLAAGADINGTSGDYLLTPLHRAALTNRAEAAEVLLERGADVNATAADGGTPLHAATFLGNVEVVTTLVEHGADVNKTNGRGNTPLDNATVDPKTTLYYASLFQLPVEPDGLGERKAEIASYLREKGARPSGQMSIAKLLQIIPIFNHLWFLWFLWWLVLGLAAISAIGSRIPTPRLPAWLVASPARYLWLVPLTMIPQAFMGSGDTAMFGPDTSAGILPMPHVFAYYAIFFGFGALLYGRDTASTPVGKTWWLPIAVALLVVFPIGMALSLDWPGPLSRALETLDPAVRRGLSVSLQAAYPWLMTFGLMGLFRRFCSAESPTLRYLSDSAYWLYLAHLPLVIGAQYLVRDWPIPALAKLAIIVTSVTVFLLWTYQVFVRYRWLGRFLNGPRTRPEPTVAATAGV